RGAAAGSGRERLDRHRARELRDDRWRPVRPRRGAARRPAARLGPAGARGDRREVAQGLPVFERDARQHRRQAGGADGGLMLMLIDTRGTSPRDHRPVWEPNWRVWRWVAVTIALFVASDVTAGVVSFVLVIGSV